WSPSNSSTTASWSTQWSHAMRSPITIRRADARRSTQRRKVHISYVTRWLSSCSRCRKTCFALSRRMSAAGRERPLSRSDLGAYLSPVGSFVPTRSTDLVSGLYAIGAIHINVKGICTNTVPVCAYRGAGRPEAAYLLERLVDATARDLGMSPDRIRRVNF